ncbi:MAG: hypothetical protein LBH09_04300, partial [Peptococcaceae bacterium]|nr:hypothetical protein [Peptococcaceae bacterium]
MIQPGSSTMRTWLQWCLRAVEFLAAGLYGFVILERCNQDGIWAVWGWVTAHGVFFFIGVLALTCAYGFVRAFFKRPFVPFALYGGLICFAGLGHYYKLYYRTEPLVPHDVFNAGPAFAIAGRTGLFLNRGLLLNFLLYAVCLLVAWLIPKYLYQPIKGRFAAVRVALVALASAAFLIFLANIPTLEAFGAVDMRYDQYQNYQYNGFVLS